MSNRKEAEAEILYLIDQFCPEAKNSEIYKIRMSQMSDEEFDDWMTNLESGEESLMLYVANLNKTTISLERNEEIAAALDFKLFQRLILTDQDTGQIYRTEAEHLIGICPLRRQVQMLWKGLSVPDGDDKADERSNQATGDDKGSGFSYPELQVNAAKGMDNMVAELIKFRGGDQRAYDAMNRMILNTGEASMDAIQAVIPSKVKATETLGILLKAMHLNNNL